MAKKKTENTKVEVIECPYLSGNKYCTHRSAINNSKGSKMPCPFARNRRRCLIWKDSGTLIKSGSESLKMEIEENEGKSD